MPSAPCTSDPIPNSKMDNKLNDIFIGNGICGVLQKWVNYGKGWKPRWFILEDGVVSYYKIHGHHKILIDHDTFKGFRIIGDDSHKRLSRIKKSTHAASSQIRDSTPVGQVHLKVSFSFSLCVLLLLDVALLLLLFCFGGNVCFGSVVPTFYFMMFLEFFFLCVLSACSVMIFLC